MDPLIQQVMYYRDAILLLGALLLLLLGGGLWRRQAALSARLEGQGLRTQADAERLEALVREQGRQLTQLLLDDRDRQGEVAHRLQQQLQRQTAHSHQALERRLGELQQALLQDSGHLKVKLTERFEQLQQRLAQSLAEGRIAQQEGLAQGLEGLGRQLMEGLSRTTESLNAQVARLTESTDQRLKEIGGLVEKRLSEGFEKSNETFNRVLQHLSRIDEAQKRITELSSNVVSLQEVLADKRSRGAFGEVQLNALVANLMPENSYALQYTLGNQTRVDCMLFLPEPSGHIAIDAKFPLESYRRMTDIQAPDAERNRAASQFRQDIRKHIDDIADKYILPGETADGAVMFIPAEAVFAEIHGHYPDLVEAACRRRVWLVSPTTLMAILTTARAVLKDADTREQLHLIQHHLHLLSKDFGRFRGRMDKLAVHIRQAHDDVKDVSISAQKISKRFGQIERVELADLPVPEGLEEADG
ncbi:DNA recombination protein RmuC [Sedimenticola hydrogenitrophicus]|uniref:DNA recombination protein RmuC n=1 Tax=Sedimenticola hydrogenitrophicus TaxID=2967975 RepID=UPI0023B11267|nr:DNA recombination protein RmuC [Sedimenticola hydrogenitrophicus]